MCICIKFLNQRLCAIFYLLKLQPPMKTYCNKNISCLKCLTRCCHTQNFQQHIGNFMYFFGKLIQCAIKSSHLYFSLAPSHFERDKQPWYPPFIFPFLSMNDSMFLIVFNAFSRSYSLMICIFLQMDNDEHFPSVNVSTTIWHFITM